MAVGVFASHPVESIRIGRRRLALVLIGNAFMRIAGSAGGILIGFYLADLANRGRAVDALVVGALASASFIVELVAALPMGVASDAVTPRALMVLSAVLGAAATQLFGLSGIVTIFFLARALEGLAGAAGGPSLLAHITDVTEGDDQLRGKDMSFYLLNLGALAGSLLGGLLARQFLVNGLIYGTLLMALIAFVTVRRIPLTPDPPSCDARVQGRRDASALDSPKVTQYG